ncbi:MAG TPA: type II toxin-antitoxin system RelE/ParE family toxin [Lacipirellulaceae bacterium]|jgi:mRNA interferase RelE/StbE
MYQVIYEDTAREEFERLPSRIKARVFGVVERLANWPAISGAKPLGGELAGRYRIRTGDYRIQFRVLGKTVLIEKMGHRDGFYER